MEAEDESNAPLWNKRIPSDKQELEKLHAIANWIPGENQIRPSQSNLEAKAIEMMNIERFYVSTSDYIWDLTFSFPTKMDSSGKLYAIVPPEKEEESIHENGLFVPNNYPYKLDEGSHHSVIWYRYGRPVDGDTKINNDIFAGLSSKLNHENFEFVWYENPKMTVPEIYHAQVFWHET